MIKKALAFIFLPTIFFGIPGVVGFILGAETLSKFIVISTIICVLIFFFTLFGLMGYQAFYGNKE